MSQSITDFSTFEIGASAVQPTALDTTAHDAWLALRVGKITGSQFDRIKRNAAGNGWSEGAESYLYELIWEHITALQAGDFTGSKQTEWGNKYEPQARERYEFLTGNKVEINQFFPARQFQGLVGCTPDGVGTKGLEIKCPYGPKAHLFTVWQQKVPHIYTDQVHGHILCAEKEACDFTSFDPRFLGKRDDLAQVIIEVVPNRFVMAELEDRLGDFERTLIERLEKLGIDWRKRIAA